MSEIREQLIAKAKFLFEDCEKKDNPEYLRGMAELIGEYFPATNVEMGALSVMVEDEILGCFDREKFEYFVRSHGFGGPTEEGCFLGWQLMKEEGDNHAQAAWAAVARGFTVGAPDVEQEAQ